MHELFYFTELERVGACKHLERPRKLLYDEKEIYQAIELNCYWVFLCSRFTRSRHRRNSCTSSTLRRTLAASAPCRRRRPTRCSRFRPKPAALLPPEVSLRRPEGKFRSLTWPTRTSSRSSSPLTKPSKLRISYCCLNLLTALTRAVVRGLKMSIEPT